MKAPLACLLLSAATLAQAAPDPAPWSALAAEYVTAGSMVDYARLKRDGVARLDGYLATLAPAWPKDWPAAERKAALINAYNAFTIRWIVKHYPVESIWRTKDPFTGARHAIDGRTLSLDAIETELRKMGDPRIHAALVCAARSCPPLRREAYTAAALDRQLDDNTRAWLAKPELNQFDAARRMAKVSSIFDWYKDDFPSVAEFLARHAPPGAGEYLRARGARIEYMTYRWGLNDTGEVGKRYSQAQFLLDRARNVF